MHRLTPISLAAVSLLSVAQAQTIWYPPPFVSLAPWFAQAAPGDIIQLNIDHPHFALNKGLTLLGPVGGGLIGNQNFQVWQSQIDVPIGQAARLIGVDFAPVCYVSGDCWGGSVTVSGTVTFDDCRFFGVHDDEAVIVADGLTVMQDCEVTCEGNGLVGGPAIRVASSATCVLTSCTLVGADYDNDGPTNSDSPAGAGVELQGRLIASHCSFFGGNGGHSPWQGLTYAAAPGIRWLAGAAYVTDCTVTGGDAGGWPQLGPGAPAVAGIANVARTNLIPGQGQPVGGPSAGVVPAPTMVGIRRIGVPMQGSTFTVVADAGSSNGLLAILVSFQLEEFLIQPLVEPLLLGLGPFIVLNLQVPAAGTTVSGSIAVPTTASLVGSDVWLQAIQLTGSSIRASASVGGTIR